MAGEIQYSYQAGRTCYYVIRNRIGQIWSTVGLSFGAYATASYANYTISVTQQGTASAFYAGTFPSTIVPGVYSITGKEQIGGSVAETDPTIATGDYQWNGSVTLPLADLATSGQVGQIGPVRVARGTMVKPFLFKLVSMADHVTPFTSGVVSGQIARDTGSFGVLQSGAFTEVGLGWYRLQSLTSGDLLADAVALSFNAVGISGGTADQRDFSFITQKVSGQ